ncbi:MAG: ABC transporter permease [Candidatus Pacebacteria bacterium]|nr:ABC transporter permease [Candidatus Paceibacterota bacterium]
MKIKWSRIYQSAFFSISRNKTRSFLTILGVVIGVFAVVVLTAIGGGIRKFIADQFDSLGANTIYVSPGEVLGEDGGFSRQAQAVSNSQLKESDISLILRIGVPIKAAIPLFQGQGKVAANGEQKTVSIIGTLPDYSSVRNTDTASGRFFTKTDQSAAKKVVVLGPKVAEEIFPDQESVGQKVTLNGIRFTVIGVVEKKGGGGFGGPDIDSQVYLPASTAQNLLELENLSTILVQVDAQENIPQAKEKLRNALLKRLDEDDFSVFDQGELLSTIDQIFQTVTIALLGIAAISLLVGGIGIMNVMLATVTERTREIGLRKAVGAKEKIILIQFLVEASALSLFGGVLGIGLGLGLALIVGNFFPIAVNPASVIIAFVVSVLTGVIFGVWPARRAARLPPVEALRYQ